MAVSMAGLVMTVAMLVVMPVPVMVFVRVSADFYVATAAAAATFLTHKIMKFPYWRFPVPARAATRR